MDISRMDVDDESNHNDHQDQGGLTIDDLVASNSNYMSASDAAVAAQIDARKIARNLAVPTSDPKVRSRLRELGEPITCFGEREMDRRERLRSVLAKLVQSSGDGGDAQIEDEEESSSDSEKEEEFFTEGTEQLLQMRRRVAAYSLVRAKKRIANQKRDAAVGLTQLINMRKKVFEPIKSYTNLGSQVGADRPISMVRFSPNASLLATASWSGSVKLWGIPDASEKHVLRGHSDKVGGLAWHPKATIGQSEEAVNLVTGAGDNNVCLWSLKSDRPLATLQGHEGRVARTAFHPTGAYVASAAFDGTWRLWDVNSQSCLLIQEGHSKQVYSVEFQDDGALVASGGLDAIGRVWDVRTGRSAMILDGHVKEILSIDFAPNGYQVATASGDDTVRIWDMRALKSIYTIPAHGSSVADVRFFRDQARRRNAEWFGPDSAETSDVPETEADEPISRTGLYLATAGYDGMVKVWSADDWQLLRALSGDGGRVMSADISSDGQYIASGEWGRTFKLWGRL